MYIMKTESGIFISDDWKKYLRLRKPNTMNQIFLPLKLNTEISEFAEKADVQKIVLFGSRARETATERSDVDIAVWGGNFDEFYWNIKDNSDSLLMFDIIDMNQKVSDELKKEIERDGVTIYEKT